MRLLSSSQVPRSISLQRSEQKGRQRCSVTHVTGLSHVGQLTVFVLPLPVATTDLLPTGVRA